MNNLLQIALREFKVATKPFSAKRRYLGSVLLAYESGFLSIESGNVRAVMYAKGEWQGRAIFSPEILRALATVPPTQDPVVISYADGHLLIGGMTIKCDWQVASKATVESLVNPGIIDLLAMERTVPRLDVVGTSLGKKIRSAELKTERRIKKAAEQLSDLDITEYEIRVLVEEKIQSRLKSKDT
jgi:hypothetical protein